MFLGPSLGTMPLVSNGQISLAAKRPGGKCNQVLCWIWQTFSLLKPSIYVEDYLDVYLLGEPAVFVSKGLLHKEQNNFSWEVGVRDKLCFSHHLPGTRGPHFISKSINTQHQIQDLGSKILFSVTNPVLTPFLEHMSQLPWNNLGPFLFHPTRLPLCQTLHITARGTGSKVSSLNEEQEKVKIDRG